jgi:hypothetical protein
LKKVSKKVKVIVYAGMNIGVFIWGAAYCLESASLGRSVIVLISSLGLINVFIWSGFRAKNGYLDDK